MTVEPVTVPLDLNAQWPLFNDPRKEGDDHIRVTKKALRLVARAMGGSRAVTPLVDTDLTVEAGLTYVQPEGLGTSGTILTITPSEAAGFNPLHPGAVIMIRSAASSQPITVSHDPLGNQNTVALSTGLPYVMDQDNDALVLWYDGDHWVELCRALPAGRYAGDLTLKTPDATLTLDDPTPNGGIVFPPVTVKRGPKGELFLNSQTDDSGDNPAMIALSPNPDFNAPARIFLFQDTRTWDMQLVFGDGSGDPTSVCATIQPTDYNSLKFTGQQEFPGTTAEPLTLKSTYLWEDSAGKLRYKKGGAKPTSDAQGTVLASVPLATASISASGPLDFTIPTSGYTSYVFEIQGVGSNTTTVGPIILCSFDGTNFVTSGYEVAGYTLLKTGVIAYHNTTPSGVPLLVAGNTFSASGGLTGYVWFNNGYFTWQLGGLVKNGAANLHAISVGAASGGGSPAKIRFTTSSSGLDTGNIVLRGFVQ